MISSPLSDLSLTAGQILANLAVTASSEHIDNPYAKAVLAPLIESLVHSLMGMTGALPSVPRPDLEDFMNKAKQQLLFKNPSYRKEIP